MYVIISVIEDTKGCLMEIQKAITSYLKKNC